MNLDEVTRRAFQDFVDGRRHLPDASPLTKRLVEIILFIDQNKDELDALAAAKNGNLEPLAKIVESKGKLQVLDARSFVAERIRGAKKQQGGARAQDNIFRRVQLFMKVSDLIAEEGLTQSTAIQRLMSEGFVTSKSFDTIRSDFRLGRKEFYEVFDALGFKVESLEQKS